METSKSFEYVYMTQEPLYRTAMNKESVEEWLAKNKPSTTYSDGRCRWIHVIRTEGRDSMEDEDNMDGDSDGEDVEGLQIAWENLKASGKHVSKENIFELAKNFRVTDGKWIFFVPTGEQGDYLWSLVAKGIASGSTLASEAKISAKETGKESSDACEHVVCIYNDNFLDKDQVYESERTIRSLGIECSLHYKPDVFTCLGVYQNNPWNLAPTIYTSNFDTMTKQSNIEEVS